jgi:hypothetical protein
VYRSPRACPSQPGSRSPSAWALQPPEQHREKELRGIESSLRPSIRSRNEGGATPSLSSPPSRSHFLSPPSHSPTLSLSSPSFSIPLHPRPPFTHPGSCRAAHPARTPRGGCSFSGWGRRPSGPEGHRQSASPALTRAPAMLWRSESALSRDSRTVGWRCRHHHHHHHGHHRDLHVSTEETGLLTCSSLSDGNDAMAAASAAGAGDRARACHGQGRGRKRG